MKTLDKIKDEVAKNCGYHYLKNTKGWNRWDKMIDESVVARNAHINQAMELCAMNFADWINRNGYEPMPIFPLKDNKKWSCDDGETTKTTKQLYEEFTSEG